jgi:hypothetical protein
MSKEGTMDNEGTERPRRGSVSNDFSDGEGNHKGDGESEQTPCLEWSKENEDILAEWCDIAQCYKWLNLKAHQKYSRLHAWFTIPAITLSTITGTAAFAQTSLPVNMQVYAPMVIGTINIMIGILTTIQQYLKISELNEAHRVAGISWDKFARNIRIELAKKLDERIDAGHMLKICRQEFDRLMETSPMIPEKIVNDFQKVFGNKEIKKPDIIGDSIVSVNEIRNNWYDVLNDDNENAKAMSKELQQMAAKNKDEFIRKQNDKMQVMQKQLDERIQGEEKALLEKQHQDNKAQEALRAHLESTNRQIDKINSYIRDFEDLYERKPESHEIQLHVEQNMKNEIETAILDQFLFEYSV